MRQRYDLRRRSWNRRWDLVSAFTPPRLVPTQLRRTVQRRVFRHIGAARMAAEFRLDNSHLHVGDNVFINDDVTIDRNADVVIEDGVSIGPGFTIVTSSHLVGPSARARSAS